MPNVGIAKVQVSVREQRSVVTQQYGKAPLQVHAPLYLDDADFPTVYLRTPSAGLLNGDQHQLDIEVETGARLEVRTQAATMVYPGETSQRITINVGEDGHLHFVPHPLILAKGARFHQAVRINLSAGARLTYADHWCAGRIAMGEAWLFDSFQNLVEIRREGSLLYRERWTLRPAESAPTNRLICGKFTHFKSLYEFGLPGSEAGADSCKRLSWVLQRQGGRVTRTAEVNGGGIHECAAT